MNARKGLLVVAALVAVISGVALLMKGSEPADMPIRTVVRSLLVGEPMWDVVRANPTQAPGVEVITPSADYRIDGADMPALALPPPAEVSFAISSDDGDVQLRMRAGVDRGVVEGLRRDQLAQVRFEVLVNGELVFDHGVHLERRVENPWEDVGGEAGLALSPGDVVTLRTELLRADGEPFSNPKPLLAGFGGCLLERTEFARRSTSSSSAPNIVFIVMDTERADRLQTYGHERATSPRLDELAARGITFEAAHATASWTWPSTASMLTGLTPEEHGVTDGDSCYLAHELTTVAEVLQARGYTTAAWTANPLIVRSKNFDQGFESFDSQDRFRKSTEFLREACEWVEAQGERRFFLYLHLVDTHGPYEPHVTAQKEFAVKPPEGIGERLKAITRGLLMGSGHTAEGEIVTEEFVPSEEQEQMRLLYDACVRTGDLALGRVLDALECAGLTEKTVVVFTSDHGEELFDHGLVMHGNNLFTETTRVPLVIAGPGIPAGRRVATPVSNRHIAPTLVKIGDGHLDLPEGLLDLTAVTAENSIEARPVFYSTEHGWWNGLHRQPLFGIRDGDWVLHWAPVGRPWGVGREVDAGSGETRLYNLARDPSESLDLADEEPTRAADMLAALKAAIEERLTRRTTTTFGAGASTMQMLKDVGYVDDE